MIPHLTRRWDSSAEVRLNFDRAFVETLKETIPAPYRAWNPAAKHWVIRPPYVGDAERLLRCRFGDLLITVAPSPFSGGPTPIRTGDPDYAALHLLPSAPAELVAAAYKTLAKTTHPDAGGDTGTMQALNAVYGRLKAKGAA